MTNSKYALIVNPLSGGYNNKKINKIIDQLKNSAIEVIRFDLEKNQKIDEIIEQLDSNEIQNIIFAFGDGTINNACNALLKRNDYDKFIISILPMGTANILSMELNCDSIEKSLKAISNNNIKTIPMVMLDGWKYFILMASAGFDSYTVRNINENLKKKIGKFAYIYEFLKILLKRDFKKLNTKINK